jgi:hypothetical protein
VGVKSGSGFSGIVNNNYKSASVRAIINTEHINHIV